MASAAPMVAAPVLTAALVVFTCLCFNLHVAECNGEMKQTFSKEPKDQASEAGGYAVLECTVENKVGNMQWTKDNFGLGASDEIWPRYTFVDNNNNGQWDLHIRPVTLADDGMYECQVSAGKTVGANRSRRAKLTVKHKFDALIFEPSLAQPTAHEYTIVEVVADTPTNVTCTATRGRPPANVTWWKDGARIDDSVYSIEESETKRLDASAMLNITGKKNEKLEYECRADNTVNAIKRKIILDVIYAPILSMRVIPTGEVREGEALTFKCSADANPSDAIVWRWYVAGVAVAGVTGPTYNMKTVGREHHNKPVVCEATNKAGNKTTHKTLSVRYSPHFIGDPKHAEVDLGQDAVLTCKVDSNPDPHIVWKRRDDPKETIISRERVFQLEKVSEKQFGIYTCSATIPDFEPIKAEFHILKKGPPAIMSEPAQFARLGFEGIIKCRINAVPVATVMWARDNTELDLKAFDRYATTEQLFPGGVVGRLVINNVQESDFGNFNCSMDNQIGVAMATITLNMKAVVPAEYILAFLLVGVLLIIIISIVIFVCHRRRRTESGGESTSNSSVDSATKKSAADLTSSPYKPYVDTWRPEMDQNFYRQPAYYDELSYPARDGRRSANPYDVDYHDGYEHDIRRDYGTYPGRVATTTPPYYPRYDPGSPYSPSMIPVPVEYGTYGRAPSRQSCSSGPPRATLDSRLSTNV